MLDSVFMVNTEFLRHVIIIFKVELYFRKDVILFDDFVKDVHVEGKSVYRLKVFDQLVAKWASYSIIFRELLEAISAESMTAVD